MLVSSLSRALRSLEIRLRTVQLDPPAQRYVMDMVPRGVRVIAHRPDRHTVEQGCAASAHSYEEVFASSTLDT